MAELCIPCEQFVNSGENHRKNTEIPDKQGKYPCAAQKKTPAGADVFVTQPILFSFRVMELLRRAAVFLCRTPRATA